MSVDVGIGLPSTIPEIPGRLTPEWAVAAERAGFSTLGTIDRIVYGNQETVPALAAAAAVTERIRLTTSILIAPYRGNGALLAKQLATVDVLSGGRLSVGIAVGGRDDDYEATGSPFRDRGQVFDAQLAEMRAVWAQESRGFAGAIGPAPVQPGGPALLFGGTADAAYRRMAEYGAGWIAGGGGPEAFAGGADQARRAWRDAGREGEPRLVGLAYASLGADAEDHARRYLTDYYAFLGEFAAQIAAGALTSPQAVADTLAAFADAGCDELILFPCNPDLAQVALLAEAAGL
jgi:alkanesulfonate monooxygenase SsuD/methylene tetrahydromethanopterin reductase-like flavin-dependent oxidoreductase (luciferase family)